MKKLLLAACAAGLMFAATSGAATGGLSAQNPTFFVNITNVWLQRVCEMR